MNVLSKWWYQKEEQTLAIFYRVEIWQEVFSKTCFSELIIIINDAFDYNYFCFLKTWINHLQHKSVLFYYNDKFIVFSRVVSCQKFKRQEKCVVVFFGILNLWNGFYSKIRLKSKPANSKENKCLQSEKRKFQLLYKFKLGECFSKKWKKSIILFYTIFCTGGVNPEFLWSLNHLKHYSKMKKSRLL